MGQFLQQLINGIQIGSIYALIALGYTMVYGIVKLINFAHADIFMFGAYMGFFLAPVMAKIFGGAFIPTIIAAMLIAVVLIGINIVMTVSLDMVNGFTGQFFVGRAGFMAVGAYTSAMITTVRLLKDSLEVELGHLGTMEYELEKEMEAYAENHQETREDLANLLSMKGIGVISAMNLLYLFRKYPGTNRNEIAALAGLDPA